MSGFELLARHKVRVIDNGLFSTQCILKSPDGKIQGKGATLPLDDPDYNPKDSLKCFAPFIGLTVSSETGFGVFGDSAEITLNINSVTIGKIEAGWAIKIYYPLLKKWVDFKIESVASDRLLGYWFLKPSLSTKQGQGKTATPEQRAVGGL